MQLITAFISNPVKVAVGVLLLVLFGVIAVFQMPVELTPNVEQKWLSVNTMWPGAGPEEIERDRFNKRVDFFQSIIEDRDRAERVQEELDRLKREREEAEKELEELKQILEEEG